MNKIIFALAILSCSIMLAYGQAGLVLLLPDASAAAVDYFLKLEGVDGESADSKHKNWIDVESFSFGVSTSGSGGGGGAGKASFSDFTIVKKIDKSSPVLLVESASGKHFTKAQLVVVKDGVEAMKWDLKDVAISSYQLGTDEEAPSEMVSMSLAVVEVSYGSTTTGWDLKTNKKTTGTAESAGAEPAKTLPEAKKQTAVKSTAPSATTPSTPSATRAPADSDGDGIADDKDKCPSEAETKNSYQDDDGCPDKAPASTVTPKTITPIAPKIAVPLK